MINGATTNTNLLARDDAHLIHPLHDRKLHERGHVWVKGDGAIVTDADEMIARVGKSGSSGAGGQGDMTTEEAYDILGLEAGASDEDIKTAHHELMGKIHPDKGGSTYLATKINQAKDVLLGT